MPNSPSSAVTISASVKESSRPDSKSESSGAGSIGLPATLRMISMILLCLSIEFVLLHQIGKQTAREPPVARRSKVHVIALRQPRVNPIPHRAFAAHAHARVPIDAAVLAAGTLLRRNDAIHAGERTPRPA